MGLFDMLLGGHHGGKRHGGHHDDDDHHRRRQAYDPGWGHGNCDNGSGSHPPPRNAGLPPETSAPLVCPACRTANGATARFCQQCGSSLTPAQCAQCGSQVSGGSKFCGQCGKPCP